MPFVALELRLRTTDNCSSSVALGLSWTLILAAALVLSSIFTFSLAVDLSRQIRFRLAIPSVIIAGNRCGLLPPRPRSVLRLLLLLLLIDVPFGRKVREDVVERTLLLLCIR